VKLGFKIWKLEENVRQLLLALLKDVPLAETVASVGEHLRYGGLNNRIMVGSY
jgi:hypothetical protein